MTNKQIEALKYLIIKSDDATDLTKKILFLLIERSEGLTKDVSLTLWEGGGITADEVRRVGTHRLNSTNSKTHLGALLALMGTDFHFSAHYGHYVEGDDELNTKGGFSDTDIQLTRYTFWLAKQMYGHGGPGENAQVSLEELNSVELSDKLYAV